MGRWHSIAGKKAAWDAAKSKNYAKIGRIIQIAAKGWADASMNPQLQMALQKAKYYSLPRDVIDKAIKKWSWQIEWEQLQEITYEWYGPGWAAVVIKTLTSNSNRTNSNLKLIMHRWWWNLWQEWAVLRQFSEDGVFLVDWITKKEIVKWNEVETVLPFNKDELELQLMDLPIKDMEFEWEQVVVYVDKKDFTTTRSLIDKMWYHIANADIAFIPNSTVKLNDLDKEQMLHLIEMIEDDEDISEVFHNAELE